jgi:hypothetical protein
MRKEYNNRWNAPLVNPSFTLPCVPYSELAMHLKIAGRPMRILSKGNYDSVTVIVDGETYTGLMSELVPFELRG